MMIGLIYLGSVLLLTLLIQLAAREPHETTQASDVFRFPRVLIISLRMGAFIPGLLGILIYRTFVNPGILEIGVLTGLFGSMTLIILAMLLRVSTFSVAVSQQRLQLNDRGRRRTIDFTAVREIVVAWPWRGNGRVDLIGVDTKRLCRIDAGVQDFEELVGLLDLYCTDKTTIRERDTRGQWMERTKGSEDGSR
jgi:hypothetical protein